MLVLDSDGWWDVGLIGDSGRRLVCLVLVRIEMTCHKVQSPRKPLRGIASMGLEYCVIDLEELREACSCWHDWRRDQSGGKMLASEFVVVLTRSRHLSQGHFVTSSLQNTCPCTFPFHDSDMSPIKKDHAWITNWKSTARLTDASRQAQLCPSQTIGTPEGTLQAMFQPAKWSLAQFRILCLGEKISWIRIIWDLVGDTACACTAWDEIGNGD